MATLLDLPAELLLQILSYFRVGGNIPRQYSGICRRLQEFIDIEYLRIYSLRSLNYHRFNAIFSLFPHRRRILKVLNYIIVLPEYDRHREEHGLETSANNKAFLNALVPLFKILSAWEGNGSDTHDIDESYGFTLILKAVAKPRFSRAVWGFERGIRCYQGDIPESRHRLSYSHRNSASPPISEQAFDWPRDSSLSDSNRTPRSFPRLSSISLPPGTEKNLSVINCVRSLKLDTYPSEPLIYSNDSEFSRDIDPRVLQLLASRMVGL
ncbi:hypothetical protein EV426DRAFT_208053 [Tirmania nivea]|nr:hypothetical protein EV426DRAFT_208053 [Tirmania nivea]